MVGSPQSLAERMVKMGLMFFPLFLIMYFEIELISLTSELRAFSNSCWNILISSNIGNSKLEIRTNIAFGYLVFGVIQISYINIFIQSMDPNNLFLIIIPIICFFISQIIFNKISGNLFPILINYMVLIYGIFLLF